MLCKLEVRLVFGVLIRENMVLFLVLNCCIFVLGEVVKKCVWLTNPAKVSELYMKICEWMMTR